MVLILKQRDKETKRFLTVLRKKEKPGKSNFVISVDELYVEKIYEVLKKGKTAKGKLPEGDISSEECRKRRLNRELVCQCSHRRRPS